MTRDEECSSGPDDAPDAFEEARQALKHAEAELAKAREEQRRAAGDLSEAEKKLEEATRTHYVFFVGKERFETRRHELTAAEIKAMVPNWHPEDALELEGHGDEPNRIIRDEETVRLNKEHPLHFVAVPPAVFGAAAGNV